RRDLRASLTEYGNGVARALPPDRRRWPLYHRRPWMLNGRSHVITTPCIASWNFVKKNTNSDLQPVDTPKIADYSPVKFNLQPAFRVVAGSCPGLSCGTSWGVLAGPGVLDSNTMRVTI